MARGTQVVGKPTAFRPGLLHSQFRSPRRPYSHLRKKLRPRLGVSGGALKHRTFSRIACLVGTDDLAGVDHATLRTHRSLRVGHGGRRHRGGVGRNASAVGGRGHRSAGGAAVAAAGRFGAASATAAAIAAATLAAVMAEDVQQAAAMATLVTAAATVVATAGRFASWSSTGWLTGRRRTGRLTSRLSAAVLLAATLVATATVVTAATAVAIEQAPQATEQVVAVAGLDAPVVAATLHVTFAAAVATVAVATVATRRLAGRGAGRLAGWRSAGRLACRGARLLTGRSTRLLTTLWLATTVAAAVIQAQHAVQELEAEALARQAYADYQRADKHVPSHRASSPFTSRTSRFAYLNRDRHDASVATERSLVAADVHECEVGPVGARAGPGVRDTAIALEAGGSNRRVHV